MQIIGVHAKTLLRMADSKLLRLRPCSLQCAKLKRRTAELQELRRQHRQIIHLHRLYVNGRGGGDDVRAIIQAATHLVDSYNSSSLFQTICNSRRMERDMAQMRRRVDAACSSLTANICCIIHAPTTSAQTTYYYPDLRS
ncbi:hypothetical protein U9M48_041483 [Paspalum notatum var. saurae]|uniref:Uncharacterized protein n=1 Tax=Paspalum notatum var. saurae TaxID=547442 RepID=A0AAQ3UNV3_PASNO